MKPQISIIIPTYNGAHKIETTLRALEEQTWSIPKITLEVIVVIDGSSDGTAAFLHNQNYDFDLKIIDQKNQGRAASRNRGAKEARAALLVFFDDDIRPIPACLQIHWEHHTHTPSSILVGNPLEDMEKMQTDIQKFRALLSRKWTQPLHNIHTPLPKEQLFLTAANFSIPKKTFEILEGFDQRLKDAEDYDLAVRANENNIPIFFNAKALGWHDDWITCKSYIHRGRQYREAHQALKEIKPELYMKYNIDAFSQAKGLKKWIYRFFSQKTWVQIIDHTKFLMIFPKGLRYKVYDLVITGLVAHFPKHKI